MKQWLLLSPITISTTISITILISQTSLAQDCNDLIGTWVSDAGSTLNIKEIEASTGFMKVSFKSPSNLYSDGPFDGTGYVGNMNKSISLKPEQSVVTTITFTFKWPEESVSAWTGHCNVNNQGVPVIQSQWLESRPVADKPIEHTLTGITTFKPSRMSDGL